MIILIINHPPFVYAVYFRLTSKFTKGKSCHIQSPCYRYLFFIVFIIVLLMMIVFKIMFK